MRKENKKLPKLLVILGPTASGKTNWSLRLAEKIDSEIISADSRQIYKQMDIGTAKEPGEWKRSGLQKAYFISEVPHYLVDFLNPGKRFSVAEFRDKSVKHAKQITNRNKVPMVVGGTGLYVSALVDNMEIPRVAPNKKLRTSLEEKSNSELLTLLEQMDPAIIEKIDKKNKRRIIRALEVCIFTGEPFSEQQGKGEQLFDILQIGIDTPREVLYDRINVRVDEMMKRGLLKEVEMLLKRNYSWELPSMSGIGYRQFRDYFEKKCTLDQAIERLKVDSRRYARRQLTWFKRDDRIKWASKYEEAEKMVSDFLQDNN